MTLFGSERFTVRALVIVSVAPPGIVRTRFVRRGACMLKRGSGPSVEAICEPSGLVTTLVPSVLLRVTVCAPLVDRRSTLKLRLRPSAEVIVTVWPLPCSVRTRLLLPPAGSSSLVRRPRVS